MLKFESNSFRRGEPEAKIRTASDDNALHPFNANISKKLHLIIA